jgi:PAS domain S-box-containing protein
MTLGNQVQVDDAEALRERLAELEAELLRRQESQRTCDQRFRSFADAAPVMIWMGGADARCTYCNRAWIEFRGRTLEQELDHGWMDGLHPEDRESVYGAYLKAFAGRYPFRAQFRMQRAGGEYGWVESAGVARHGEDGAFAGYMGAAIELTGRKRPMTAPDEQSVRTVFALTERERQVLALIAQGNSTKQTAARLGISYKTADSHRTRILEKLGVHETASMVRYAIRAGLIEA